jgi:hypothetical protein
VWWGSFCGEISSSLLLALEKFCHFLWPLVSDEKSTVIEIVFAHRKGAISLLRLFNIFSLSLVFRSLTVMNLGVGLL